jgi:uncharacterized protein YdeI (BOF family)
MYTKIEQYHLCDIYKNIDVDIYVAVYNGKKIATGKYMNVKQEIDKYHQQNIVSR